ncbi:MAG: N-methyl-L-tryptophan oxidase [Pirellulales bacterium]|nr:N-methyl-L-tryptophan oxidase [Pirellulales bacterium]
MITAEALVLGSGGIGSAALAALARRGCRVIGIDRFSPPHDRGSSHGQTRIIRQAYFEHPDYVPLVLRAFDLWHDLEARSGVRLYHECGLLQVGRPGSPVVAGVRASAERHRLPLESLSAAEAMRRFPGFYLPPDGEAVFERRAGVLLVEACVRACLDDAVAHGASLRVGEMVIRWKSTGDQIEVQTDCETYLAPRVVIAAGPWAADLLDDSGLHLTVRRKAQFWFEPGDPVYRAEAPCPAFLFDTPTGIFYGMPAFDERGVKLAEHTGGEVVPNATLVDRSLRPEDEQRVRRFAAEHLPHLSDRRTDHAVCLYTMSPDEHFVLDRHPRQPKVAFVAGLSGHGFKFAPVLGEALADLVLAGRTALPVDFLGLARPSLRA